MRGGCLITVNWRCWKSRESAAVGKPAGKSAAGVVTGTADAKPTPLQQRSEIR